MKEYWGLHIQGGECPCEPEKTQRIRGNSEKNELIVEWRHNGPKDVIHRREMTTDEVNELLRKQGVRYLE